MQIAVFVGFQPFTCTSITMFILNIGSLYYIEENYMRCGVQDRRSVSKRDDSFFVFLLMKVEEGVGKDNYHASLCFSVFHSIWRKSIKRCSYTILVSAQILT